MTVDEQEMERIRQRKIMEMVRRAHDREKSRELDNDGKPVTLTDDTFGTVQKYPMMLVDFWAAWCGPCRIVSPVIERLAGEYQGKVWFGKLNVDENPVTANHFAIQSIPAMLLFKEGVRVDGLVGAVPKATIESMVNRHMEQN